MRTILPAATAVLVAVTAAAWPPTTPASATTVTRGPTSAVTRPPTTAAKRPAATAKPRVGVGKAVTTANAAPTTKEPRPVSAGTPLVGWDRIHVDEWPAAGDAVIVKAKGTSIDVLRSPGDRRGALRLVQGRSMAGPIRLLGLGANAGWVRVGVPIRPNGTAGWVRNEQLEITRSTLRVVVETATNTLTVEDGGRIVQRTQVSTGTGGTPTPTGLFFVKEIVPQANPNGAFGPVALGLSGFSDVLFSFNGGEATIAIHGTNAPGKLGSNASHGCVRVDNSVVIGLAKTLPLGTPVEIVRTRQELPPTGFRKVSSWTESLFSVEPPAPILDDEDIPVLDRSGQLPPVASPDPIDPNGNPASSEQSSSGIGATASGSA